MRTLKYAGIRCRIDTQIQPVLAETRSTGSFFPLLTVKRLKFENLEH